jgi:hypothetical protein
MASLLLLWIGALIRLFRSRGNLVLENLMLRQQLVVLKRRHPRPSLGFFDKFLWVIARRVWSAWKEPLIIRYARDRRPLAPDWFSYVVEADHIYIYVRSTCTRAAALPSPGAVSRQ